MRNADRFYSPSARGPAGPGRCTRIAAIVAALVAGWVFIGAVPGDLDASATIGVSPVVEQQAAAGPTDPATPGPRSPRNALCDAAPSIAPGCATR